MKVEMNIIKAICDDEDIHMFMLPKSESQERLFGVAMSDGKCHGVFVRDDLGKWETVHVAAHEVAHILSGHVHPKNEKSKEQIEQEARMFAAAFLALSVIKKYGGGDSNA